MLNLKIIFRTLGFLILGEGLFMLLPFLISILYAENDSLYFLYSSLITLAAGALLYFPTSKAVKNIGKRDGYVIVSLIWILFSIFGSLPYLMSNSITTLYDAFFESMSGFTTTGATILDNIEEMSHGILFWRSLTQWLGGIGIIFMSLAILPTFGITGMSLLPTENPGITVNKANPKIIDTVKFILLIYIALTLSESVLLLLGGMNFFDAVCQSFATISTGGFSTRQSNIAYWNSPFINYTLIFFMILGGTNFSLIYFSLKGSPGRMLKNDEFKSYISLILIFSIIIGVGLYLTSSIGIGSAIENSLFQVVSVISTTGFVTNNYLQWNQLLLLLLFCLMFIGGTVGSAAGGLKVMRIVLLGKNSYHELKRLIHPNAIMPIRCNQRSISTQIIANLLVFCFSYITIFLLGSLVLMMLDTDFLTAMGSVASCLGNIGPGLGHTGYIETYSHISPYGKILLSLIMLLGRVEIFGILVIFSPYFWKQ